ncbi:MAG: phosphotransferase [Planctomycetota bacterium]
MRFPPAHFESDDAYRAARVDTERWAPVVHHLLDTDAPLIPGHNPTHPTFVVGDRVVKFFGHRATARAAFEAERAAQALIALDDGIAAPRLLDAGPLCEGWSYLVTTRIAGQGSHVEPMDADALARALGEQIRRVHALPPSLAIPTFEFDDLDVVGAAHRSSLPDHLARQAAAYVRALPSPDPVFVHGDLAAMHAFVSDGAFSGIIDWGDAIVADRHYELIQLYRCMFGCDPARLRTFLDAYDWPMTPDFPHRVLGQALYRQATGLIQHLGMDVFEPVAESFDLDSMRTLEEMAEALFWS